MTLTLPDSPTTERMSEAELRLELACALFAQGKIGKVGGAELAGVDFSRSKARLESGASVSTPLR